MDASNIYKVIWLLLVVSCFEIQSQTCAVSFSPAVHYTFTSPPAHLISADLDLDGNEDIACVHSSTASFVSVILGSATGTFGVPQTFTTANGSNDLISADLNGDNKLDLIIANFTSNNISVLLGTGTGSFLPVANYTTASGPRHLACTDFNGDLKPDLAVSAANVASVAVLFGNGAGSFTSSANFGVGSQPQGVIAADFNNDSNSDIISANQADNTISLLLGNGSGGFLPTVNFTISGNPRKLAYADFNNDGNKDVAVANFQSPQVSVLLGTGTGSFNALATYVSGIGAVCYGITVSDLNNDGSIDIATPNNALSTAAVLLGSTSGTFAMGVGFPIQSVPLGITSSDFNGDGKIDLATTNIGGTSVSVLLNSTAFPTVSIASSSNSICNGQTATLSATGATTYTWNTSQTSTSISVSPTITTTYSVAGTATNACSSTAVFIQSVIVCAGVDELEKGHKTFVIAPNPFNERFEILSSEIVELEIFSTQGKKILSVTTSEPITIVDLKDQAPGVYFIRTSNGLFTGKVIKE